MPYRVTHLLHTKTLQNNKNKGINIRPHFLESLRRAFIGSVLRKEKEL